MKDSKELETEEQRLLALTDREVLREAADEAWAASPKPSTCSHEAWIEGWIDGHAKGYKLREPIIRALLAKPTEGGK